LEPQRGDHQVRWIPFEHPAWAASLLLLFVATRLYYLVLGWQALGGVHGKIRKRRQAFLIGFVPMELAGAIGFSFFTLVLGYMMVSNWE
jgi:hypothetical protein